MGVEGKVRDESTHAETPETGEMGAFRVRLHEAETQLRNTPAHQALWQIQQALIDNKAAMMLSSDMVAALQRAAEHLGATSEIRALREIQTVSREIRT